MAIGTAIAVYFIIWWVVLFMTLPFRAKTQLQAGEVVEGSDPAAPADPQIKKRMIWNSIVALGFFGVFWYLAVYLDLDVNDLPQIITVDKVD